MTAMITALLRYLQKYMHCTALHCTDLHYEVYVYRYKNPISNFIFCRNSFLYAKLTRPQKNLFQNLVLNILQAFHIRSIIMSSY